MKVRLPQGMGGGPANMQSMLKQAQKMQEDMAAKQAELEACEYDISAGGGVVNVKINGTSTRGNIAPCCKECNNRKKYLTPAEMIMFELEAKARNTAPDANEENDSVNSI